MSERKKERKIECENELLENVAHASHHTKDTEYIRIYKCVSQNGHENNEPHSLHHIIGAIPPPFSFFLPAICVLAALVRRLTCSLFFPLFA